MIGAMVLFQTVRKLESSKKQDKQEKPSKKQ